MKKSMFFLCVVGHRIRDGPVPPTASLSLSLEVWHLVTHLAWNYPSIYTLSAPNAQPPTPDLRHVLFECMCRLHNLVIQVFSLA